MSEDNKFFLFIKETEIVRPSFGKISGGNISNTSSPRR
jgi:hypothetical protein